MSPDRRMSISSTLAPSIGFIMIKRWPLTRPTLAPAAICVATPFWKISSPVSASANESTSVNAWGAMPSQVIEASRTTKVLSSPLKAMVISPHSEIVSPI